MPRKRKTFIDEDELITIIQREHLVAEAQLDLARDVYNWYWDHEDLVSQNTLFTFLNLYIPKYPKTYFKKLYLICHRLMVVAGLEKDELRDINFKVLQILAGLGPGILDKYAIRDIIESVGGNRIWEESKENLWRIINKRRYLMLLTRDRLEEFDALFVEKVSQIR